VRRRRAAITKRSKLPLVIAGTSGPSITWKQALRDRFVTGAPRPLSIPEDGPEVAQACDGRGSVDRAEGAMLDGADRSGEGRGRDRGASALSALA
jgi:hypothetical protein